jgi:hypothetical protein
VKMCGPPPSPLDETRQQMQTEKAMGRGDGNSLTGGGPPRAQRTQEPPRGFATVNGAQERLKKAQARPGLFNE